MLSFIDLTQAAGSVPSEKVDDGSTNGPALESSSSGFYTQLIIGVYMLYLAVQLYKHDVKISWSLLLKLITLSVIYWTLTYPNSQEPNNYGTIIFITTLVLVHKSLRSPHLPVLNKAVIITGCDRGFGHALAVRLDQMGFKVFAGCLFKGDEGAEALKAKCSDRLHILQLDVTDPQQVDSAFITIKENLGNDVLWGVVNNAGICYIGNTEMIPREDSLKIMDVNFRGPYLLTTKLLPLLRRSGGRIVNVSSNAGLAPVPLMGLYCCSKSALFMYSEVLRAENERWGVNVSAIIPSGYKTGIIAYDKEKMAEKWWARAPKVVQEDFGRKAFLIKDKAGDSQDMLSKDLSPVINAMVDGLLSTNPKHVYYTGFLARSLPFLYLHLPSMLREPVMGVLADWFEFQPACLQVDQS